MLTWLLVPFLAVHAPPAAAQTSCTRGRVSDVFDVQPPAVVVLGERKGTQPDLIRAERIVSRLAKQAPVTLALEAVHREHQPILDQYADGSLAPSDLPDLLHWREYWSFPFAPYEDLVTSAVLGVDVVAVGLSLGGKPLAAQMPIPPGYIHVLADAMGDHPVPVELESTFVQTVAWRDHAMARQAVSNWSGEGYLVILADRLHVEGGKGVSWQAQRLTQAPVHAFLLADAGASCYAGDTILK